MECNYSYLASSSCLSNSGIDHLCFGGSAAHLQADVLGDDEPYQNYLCTTRRSPSLASAVKNFNPHSVARRLGLYAAMKKVGRGASADIAASAGLHERFVREWLHQQVRSLAVLIGCTLASLLQDRLQQGLMQVPAV